MEGFDGKAFGNLRYQGPFLAIQQENRTEARLIKTSGQPQEYPFGSTRVEVGQIKNNFLTHAGSHQRDDRKYRVNDSKT
ncbi:hypothetical protein CCP4SC76_5580002 [Gammaproteobacteria bacterium]